MTIARVFPRRTAATPTDPLAFTDAPGLFPPAVDAVHVSVTFTWDIPRAEQLARQWAHVAPVTIGGPATGMRGEEFTPGRYIAPGYVITSRGCPNRCWFCQVWRREGGIRELPIRDGWNVLDDNLLACGSTHIEAVLAMLASQHHRPRFTGGLEAARVTPEQARSIAALRPEVVYVAYDTPDDWEPLQTAISLFRDAGLSFKGHRLRAYVLVGYPKDTLADAERRCRAVVNLGVMPMAMAWRNENGDRSRQWAVFQRRWARPAIAGSTMRDSAGCGKEGG